MAPPAGSRLQKLLNLIDAGSSLDTRKAAAAQIAGIAAAHPAQLPAVLAAVSRHLRHRDWDARLAAGHCLGLLAQHFEHHTPDQLQRAATAGVAKQEEQQPEGGGRQAALHHQHHLSFAGFSVGQVLQLGTPMLASGGEVGRQAGRQAMAASALRLQLVRSPHASTHTSTQMPPPAVLPFPASLPHPVCVACRSMRRGPPWAPAPAPAVRSSCSANVPT